MHAYALSPLLIARPLQAFCQLSAVAIARAYLWQAWLQASSFHRTVEEIEAEFTIIQQAQRDPQHFGPIYERYYDQIFIFINKRVVNEELTAELTATTFYQCLKNLKRFEYRKVPFSAWLYRIASNEVNMFFRKQKNVQRSVSLQDYHIDQLWEELEAGESVDRQQLVVSLLESLSPEDLQFLELRFFEERSFREVGQILNISEGNAKVKTYRILDKMKKTAVVLLNQEQQ